MTVKLKFFADLRNYLPSEPFPYPAEVKEGATVADILAMFKIPEDKPHILLLNGVHCTLDSKPGDGDTLSLFPPVAGG
jgi:molybdopterin converting factor small subunit